MCPKNKQTNKKLSESQENCCSRAIPRNLAPWKPNLKKWRGAQDFWTVPHQQEMHFLVSACSQLIIPALFMSNIAAGFLLHLGKICLIVIYLLLAFKKNICIQ